MGIVCKQTAQWNYSNYYDIVDTKLNNEIMAYTFSELWLNWWCITMWSIGIILSILLATKLWKSIYETAVIYASIGWLCAFIAGITGIWFIGWFAWTIPLSGMLGLRIMWIRLDAM